MAKIASPTLNSMKRLNKKNINTQKYWDEHIAEPDFGLRQKEYTKLAGCGERIVDLGCGLSPFLDRARNKFEHVWGLDFSEETTKQAAKKFPYVMYVTSDATRTPFPSKTFDVSVAGELIEHLEKPEKLIREMARITKYRIIISTAKMEYNDREHLWEFEPCELEKLSNKYGEAHVKEIKSKRFPGRSYLFLTIDLYGSV